MALLTARPLKQAPQMNIWRITDSGACVSDSWHVQPYNGLELPAKQFKQYYVFFYKFTVD